MAFPDGHRKAVERNAKVRQPEQGPIEEHKPRTNLIPALQRPARAGVLDVLHLQRSMGNHRVGLLLGAIQRSQTAPDERRRIFAVQAAPTGRERSGTVIVQRAEAYDVPDRHTEMGAVINAIGDCFDAYLQTSQGVAGRKALAEDVQAALRGLVTTGIAGAEGRTLLSPANGAGGLVLSYAAGASGNSAVTVPHPGGVTITFEKGALASKSQFQSIIFHEFLHALQNSGQPDSGKTKSTDMWMHNLETVEPDDEGLDERKAHLSLGETPFDDVKTVTLDKKVTHHPGYAVNDALKEIQTHAYELTYRTQTGTDQASESEYQEETISELNRYSKALQDATAILRGQGQPGEPTLTYWSGYIAKATSLVTNIRATHPGVNAI